MNTSDLIYPDFTLDSYAQLLAALRTRWRICRLQDAAAKPVAARTLILRHDVDFSPALALSLAEIEGDQGVRATYFVALHLCYNPHAPVHARALRKMVDLGHEIGLHYDSAVYEDADNQEARLRLLQQHVDVLEAICGTAIVSIAQHNPSTALQGDPFATGTAFTNAYDPALLRDTIYLSDSCRAWRTGGLGPCWADPSPQRIYLLIHPEVWSDHAGVERLAYLPLLRQRVQQEDDRFFDEVRAIWENHAGGKEHDRRGSKGGVARDGTASESDVLTASIHQTTN